MSRLQRSIPRSGFTLAELLVAMAIIAIIAAVTVIAVGQIAKDARLSSGTNAVTAALDNARALAIKRNGIVMVAFRPREDGVEQFVEVVTARFTGEAYPVNVGGNRSVVDRFEVIPDVPARALPVGIKVATPAFDNNDDETWVTQTHLPKIDEATGLGEAPGLMLAVMFGPDGATLSRNPRTDSNRAFIDFDRDRAQTMSDVGPYFYPDFISVPIGIFYDRLPFQVSSADEPFVQIAPYLAIYDDEVAREISGDDDWTVEATRTTELTRFITERADRLHFNRYTGVAMR
ncbi:MAG: prepilin-type N-terminal cleavage/methylation domain-containing protein [Phycisphaerales bacterium]|nr:prepilin-type N-terminal cleavage/methylation domain-containing protein [Phycisphaerales bacterium]NNM25709.1 prepilin-type N-terminal cleavage/methylation domain-containing protein [Phycisphaerales bacterium]